MIFHFDDSVAVEFAGHGVAKRYISTRVAVYNATCMYVYAHYKRSVREKYTDVGAG